MMQEWHMDQVRMTGGALLSLIDDVYTLDMDDSVAEGFEEELYIPASPYNAMRLMWRPSTRWFRDHVLNRLNTRPSVMMCITLMSTDPYMPHRDVRIRQKDFRISEFQAYPGWFGGNVVRVDRLGLERGVHLFRVERLGAHPADTLAGDLEISGFRVEWFKEDDNGRNACRR